jgi:hypothetical protein
MCDASLSFFPLGPPIYMCATLVWGQESCVHCRVTGHWFCSSGPLSAASSSSEALDEIELLNLWQLAVWQYAWGCDTPGILSQLPSTKLMSLDTLVSSLSVSTISSGILLGYSNCGLLLVVPFITLPLTPTVKCLFGRIRSVCNTGCKLSLRCEKWNTICWTLNGALQRKGW